MTLMPASVTIAQMSDLHIGRRGFGFHLGDRADDAVARCITSVNAMAPDAVVITGDLAHTGHIDEYLRLRELLAELSSPFFLIPGNHDNIANLRRAFPDLPHLFETSPHVAYAVDVGFVRIIGLDSTRAGKTGGYLDSERLAWLQSSLGQAVDRPTLLALHHPPFVTGVIPIDAFGFVNVKALAGVIALNPQVRRIISGHVHCASAAHWNGTFACTSPSPSLQLLLRTMPGAPLRLWVEAPGFLQHVFSSNSSATTSVARTSGSVTQPLDLTILEPHAPSAAAPV